jgi:hypothetical protein
MGCTTARRRNAVLRRATSAQYRSDYDEVGAPVLIPQRFDAEQRPTRASFRRPR